MADIRFLPYPRFQAFDDNGKPLESGEVFVYAAGTTNKIDTWTDFDKTSKNTNPVVLDARGEADIFFDKSAKIVLKNKDGVTKWTLDNVQPLTSQTVTGKFNLVENGSFELDGDGDNKPDNWTINETTDTSSIVIDDANVAHGEFALKFKSDGGGGGTATSNRFSVADGSNFGLSFFISSNNTTATDKVDVIFYDKNGNGTSTTNIYTSGGTEPSSLTQKVFGVSTPSNKTQAEVKLTGIDNNETATTFFDFVQVLDQGYIFTGSAGEVTASASELNILDTARVQGWALSNLELLGTGSVQNGVSGVYVGDSGTKVFISNNSNDTLERYDLSTAWDITTISSRQQSFDVSGETTLPFGCFLKDDGTEIYTAGSSNRKIFQYTLSTAWDLSTASLTNTFDFGTNVVENDIKGIYFGDSGSKLYVADAGSGNDFVRQINLSTAWDLSTASDSGNNLDADQGDLNDIDGLALKNDGKAILVQDGTKTGVMDEYVLETAWSLSTGSLRRQGIRVGPGAQGEFFRGLFFRQSDDEKLFVVNTGSNDSIEAYDATKIVFD